MSLARQQRKLQASSWQPIATRQNIVKSGLSDEIIVSCPARRVKYFRLWDFIFLWDIIRECNIFSTHNGETVLISCLM